MSNLYIDKINIPATLRNGRLYTTISSSVSRNNNSGTSIDSLAYLNTFYQYPDNTSTQTVYSNICVIGNITGTSLNISCLNDVPVNNYLHTTSTNASSYIPVFSSNNNLVSNNNFTYNQTTGRLDVKQPAAGCSVITASFAGDSNSDLYGQLFIQGTTDNNKRLSIGYNTCSNYGYLQSYQNGSSKSLLKLNPQGGGVEIGSSQQESRLNLTGYEYYSTYTDTGGIAMLLGVNRVGNRQLWIGDTAKLTKNTTNPVLRIGISDGGVSVNAIATNGSTVLPLTIGQAGANLNLNSPTFISDALWINDAKSLIMNGYSEFIFYNSGIKYKIKLDTSNNLNIYDGSSILLMRIKNGTVPKLQFRGDIEAYSTFT